MKASALLTLAATLPLAACSGDGDGSSLSTTAGFDVLLTDAPADDLLFLRADVETLQLQNDDTTYTANLLPGTITVDLLSLDGVFEWLSAGEVDPGTYVGLRLGFDGTGFAAAAIDGSPVTITALADALDVDFAAPVVLAAGDYARVEVDFDLLASLSGDVGSGMLDVTPSGVATTSTGATPVPIADFKGIVVLKSTSADSLLVDAFGDGDLGVALGQVEVNLTSTTLLLDAAGAAFASHADFFAAISSGTSVVDVHGELVDGALVATKVEVESGGGTDVVVEMRGKVIDHAPGVSFELLITQIEKGGAVALPVLSGLGDPVSIDVGILAGTKFYLVDEVTEEEALDVGQTVDVKFSDFATAPFPAFKVTMADQLAEFGGEIVDLTGLPDDLMMHLRENEPAILSSDVDSATTDVVVALDAVTVVLKLGDDPALATSDLQPELEIEVDGTLSGPSSGPTITAAKIRVLPGRLTGAVLGQADPQADVFTTFSGQIEDPFGAGITAAPLAALIDPACTFSGAATTKAEFFLLNGVIGLDVLGIATGSPDEIRAYHVKSTVLKQ
jgi:hypothetical protein